jgi:7-keto-8-aminopelargonate synthetase-like enzyme
MPRLSVSQATPTTAILNGREVLSFGGCNYLGLAHHPAVHAALIDGLSQFGVSTSASRETTGNTTAHDALETALCKFLGFPAGVVVPDGYTANLAIAEVLAPMHPVGLIDSRSHRSIREAVIGARMDLVEFDHLNPDHAAKQLARCAGVGVAVFTDGVFTADGALAPIPELLEVLPRERATLIVDDCHGFCTLGPRGQGTLSNFKVSDPRVVLTTTLAKGLGCHGGLIAGQTAICDLVRSKASAYICTTPVSPAIAAAGVEALAVIAREPDRVRNLRANCERLGGALRSMGLNIAPTPAPIFAFTLGSEQQMRRLYADMLADGILAPLITYPGGPAPVYFRLSITSQHAAAQIDRLTSALGKHLEPAAPVRAAG